VKPADLPFELRILRYYPNSVLQKGASPGVNGGIGTLVHLLEIPQEKGDERRNVPGAEVVLQNGKWQKVMMVSSGIDQMQAIDFQGNRYQIALRAKRWYQPYSVQLIDFVHQDYSGTTIPKYFSSLVLVENPLTHEKRKVLISMNHPLRYMGKTYYQASFGKQDQQSIFQVVDNPSQILPYLSCSLIAFGLVYHSVIKIRRRDRKKRN